MRVIKTALSMAALMTGLLHAEDRFTEARITQIEPQDNMIILFLDNVSLTAPTIGNGATNESVNKYMLYLATSSTDVANRKHFLATALAAQASGTIVKFRWDEATFRIVAMLLR